MDSKQAAAALDGNEYRKEGSREFFRAMQEAGLVAIFGASDDLVEFRGAIDDEVGHGAEILLSAKGLVPEPGCDCDDARELHKLRSKGAREVKVEFSPASAPGLTWLITTGIPHETFTINEDGEPFCKGVVLKLENCVSA